jgi:hypothetical protein
MGIGTIKMSEKAEKSLVVEVIEFSGHPNILATHYNTIEVTKDKEISKRGDCIIGVNATKSCADLSPAMKKHIRAGGHLSFELRVGERVFEFSGRGRMELELSNTNELVLRRSDFVSDRTAAVSCDATAIDLPRSLVSELRNKNSRGTLTIRALELSTRQDLPESLLVETLS